MAGVAISVIPLLSQWEKYTSEHPDGDIPGFARWILANAQPRAETIQPATTKPQSPKPEPRETALGALLIARNHNILRLFSKPIVKALGLTKDIEFATLLQVAMMNRPNKKQLCRELLIENSTGVEITKRLAQKGLIAETPDPDDRRSALLSITDKGKKLLQQGNHQLGPVHNTFLDALTPEEKHQLISLLGRIDHHHTTRINSQPHLLQ